MKTMKLSDETKGEETANTIVKIIEYQTHALLVKSMMKTATGPVNVLSYSGGKTLINKKIAYDMYAILIDGSANIEIGGDSFILQTGQGIIIPTNTQSHIKPNGAFKLILTATNPEYQE